MKIAVLSDTHDHIWNLEKALKIVKEKSCEAIIFCGDFCAPFTAKRLTTAGVPIYACFGNNDEDQGGIIEKVEGKIKFWPLHHEFAEIELGGVKIAFCHYPKLGRLLALTGDYGAVFHGHTHEAYQEMAGKTLLANPGAVCGIVGGKPGPASLGIYDTDDNTFNHIAI